MWWKYFASLLAFTALYIGTAVGQSTRSRLAASGPDMVRIPGGDFLMGSPASESGRRSHEGPQHHVAIRSFEMGRTPVTRGQFAEFITETSYDEVSPCSTFTLLGWRVDPRLSWRNPGFEQDDSHPVVCVSWSDAKRFVGWLNSNSTDHRWRLPTEAEFEYAARGGTVTSRYWGDNPDGACATANVADSSAKRQVGALARTLWQWHDCDDGFVHTSPVAHYSPNPVGLYDMAGNVWEWVEDCYRDSYESAPRRGEAVTSADCKEHVVRGGSFGDRPRGVRSAERAKYAPGNGSSNLGFRVARTIP